MATKEGKLAMIEAEWCISRMKQERHITEDGVWKDLIHPLSS